MSNKRKILLGHSEMEPRAPVVRDTSTGMNKDYEDEQRRGRPAPETDLDDQACFGGSDLRGTSQPAQNQKLSCAGCGGKPGIGIKFSLDGPEKEVLRTFVLEVRRCYLEKMGIIYQRNSTDVPLERMSICASCRSKWYRSKESMENSQM